MSIATAIEEDIQAGNLEPGQALPTHRQLAAQLAVALTTVTRGYAEAERRGLISGEVGRGTFVRERTVPRISKGDEAADPSLIDLTVNSLFSHSEAREVARVVREVASGADVEWFLDYQPSGGAARHRKLGAEWVNQRGLDAAPEQIVITSGAQHGMAVTFATICKPGDVVLAGEFTYTGMKSLACHQHFQLEPVALDEHGLRPDSFEKACQRRSVRAVYCMPNLQNPTSALMPLDRRKEIAALAESYDVIIVEDDSYGFLLQDMQPLSQLAPSRSFYITSASKSLVPGLRVGYIRAPADMVERLAAAVCTTIWMASPLLAEVLSVMIEDGTAERILGWKRREVAERQRLAAGILAGLDFDSHPLSQHLWLRLPEPWRADEFAAQARMRGVGVTPADHFAVGRGAPIHAVRVCLGTPVERSKLEKGLKVLAEILEGPPEPCHSVV